MNWEKAAVDALWWASIAQGGFVAVYATRPWWRSRVGRALMLKSFSLGLALWLTLVNTYRTYPGELAIGACVMALIAVACTYQLVAMVTTPKADREIR